MKYKI